MQLSNRFATAAAAHAYASACPKCNWVDVHDFDPYFQRSAVCALSRQKLRTMCYEMHKHAHSHTLCEIVLVQHERLCADVRCESVISCCTLQKVTRSVWVFSSKLFTILYVYLSTVHASACRSEHSIGLRAQSTYLQ